MGSGVRIGIAGLGGMGSNVAVMLVRSGSRDLVVADFDTVDESNIARQAYLPRHLGMSKTDALVSVLHDIDPGASVEVHDTRLDTSNAAGIFSACDVVCEALDDPESKAMLVETLLEAGFTVIVIGVVWPEVAREANSSSSSSWVVTSAVVFSMSFASIATSRIPLVASLLKRSALFQTSSNTMLPSASLWLATISAASLDSPHAVVQVTFP